MPIEKTILKKAIFRDKFNYFDKAKRCVLTVISMNSEKQTKEDLEAFILAINHKYDNGELKKLIIITSAGLHLHYVKLDKSLTKEQAIAKANKMDEQW